MKNLSPLMVALVVTAYLSATGFQCGSAESTSAKLYMSQKQYDKAEESLMKEVAKNPNDEEAWYMLGQVRIELKKFLEANQAYDKALSISDQHKKEIINNKLYYWGHFLNDGVTAYNNGRSNPAAYDTAITNFESAIQFRPDSGTTYYYLALAQLGKKESDKAISSLKKALQMKPDYSDAVRVLGNIYLSKADENRDAKNDIAVKKNLTEAEMLYESAHKAQPEEVDYISHLIDVYEALGEEDKALALTRDALENDPTNRAFIYVYGEFLLKQGKYEESVNQLKKVADDVPDSADLIYTNAVYNLGVAYQNWGVAQREEARKKAEAEGKDRKGHVVQEDLSYREKYKMALPYFEKSVELKPDDASLWQQLAKLYTTLNMPDKAKGAFKKVDELTK